MVNKGGRWNYDPIEKNVSALSASPEPRAVRKQPTRSTKQSCSKKGEFICSCKYDGEKNVSLDNVAMMCQRWNATNIFAALGI